jgi:secreted trypsin-like serine protease
MNKGMMKAKLTTITLAVLVGSTLQLACSPQLEVAPEMDASYSIEETTAENLASIVAGSPVQPGDVIASSTVMILDAKSGENFCTGTLISKNLVLTAAHCTNSDPRSIKIGFAIEVPRPGIQVPARQVISGRVHPNWPKLTSETEKNWGDIAVLRFEGTVPEGYAPARVLSQKEAVQNGRVAVLAGFGDLNKMPLTSALRLMRADVVVSDANYSETEVLFEQFEGRGACHGDSGGPAFLPLAGRHVVFGVTSRAATERGGLSCLEGSVYTNTSAVMDFIRQAASELNKAHIPQPIPQPRFD